MSNVSRIFVVEGEEKLNQSLVNSLRKEGYFVRGVMSGTDAVRVLWSEEYDIVICDLKTQGLDGLEVLQWLRMYRPNMRAIMLGSQGSAVSSMQVLESGAASYIEKPVDLRVVKEELRRILQQTGFSASLDSFDLLDVIQVVNMSRNNIALLVSTGLEEQGVLRFQQGELVWAEYGVLRGEEAFFALAAHKNGTVIHQPWNGHIASNVTQPLSRLIFQALQYRTKYARMQQSGEHKAASVTPFMGSDEIDDTPFGFLPEMAEQSRESEENLLAARSQAEAMQAIEKDWWERTGNIPSIEQQATYMRPADSDATASFKIEEKAPVNGNGAITPSTVYKTPASQRTDLPSWLTEQPTASNLRALRSMSPTSATSPRLPRVPNTPIPTPSSADWQTPVSPNTSDLLASDQGSSARNTLPAESVPAQGSSSVWQSSDAVERRQTTNNLQQLSSINSLNRQLQNIASTGPLQAQDGVKNGYNYSALIAALETVGYAIPSFIATAIVSMDGQPIAQVAIDERDIAVLCKQYADILRTILLSLEQNQWGDYQDTIITSIDRFIILRLIGEEKKAFQLLITTREAAPASSMQEMSKVKGAISEALGAM
jgi:DNA-binding response OmpR family regulator/predicted regulator of Ras-like GTPase activity (Roadblock/LC7/MglB family)